MKNNRAMNMKRVSAIRSAEVQAMLDLLTDLDEGGEGDLDGFESFGIKYRTSMEARINSYRAQKIAKFLGKNISKSHLVKYAKDKDELAANDLSDEKEKRLTVDEFISRNSDSLIKYYSTLKDFYINNVLLELDSDR